MSKANRYELAVAKLLSEEATTQLRIACRHALRKRVPIIASPLLLGDCLNDLHNKHGQLRLSQVHKIVASACRQLVLQLCNDGTLTGDVAMSVCRCLSPRVLSLDALLRMPPVRSNAGSRITKDPPVIQRAKLAQRRFRYWSRRLSAAKTKCSQYQRKVKYYKRKGYIT